MASAQFSFGVELELIVLYHSTLSHRESVPQTRRLKSKQHPMDIIYDLLRKCPFDIRLCREPKKNEYTTWQMTRDMSLRMYDCQEKEEVLRQHLGEAQVAAHEDWESYGVELVSPPFAMGDLPRVQGEIQDLMSKLTTARSLPTISKRCGLHVHVGHSDNSLLPLPLLKNLVFATILHEDQLAKLHPIHRSTDNPNCWSNREAFITSDPEQKEYRVHESTGQSLQSTLMNVAEVKRTIDSVPNHLALANLMRYKHRIINWSYVWGCGPHERPPTVEFRQHAGSMHAEEIAHWVKFIDCLVQASKNACIPTVSSWTEQVSITELMDAMNLPHDTRRFYDKKLMLTGSRDGVETDDLWELAWGS